MSLVSCKRTVRSLRLATGVLFAIAVLSTSQPALGQAHQHPADSPHDPNATTADPSLAEQLVELQVKVTRLEAALMRGHQPQGAARPTQGDSTMAEMKMGPMQDSSMQGMGMKRMEGMPMMGRMSDMEGMGKRGMQGSSMQGMGMMGMDGMQMMGRMGRQGADSRPMIQSALPGFPGSSHLYHLGATGYFLDHGEHITLTRDQQTKLNQIKERVLLAQATTDRKIEQAEQDLWVLTGTDQPDVRKIEAKVSEITKLKGDQRMAFIRAVGEAAKVLTDEQRKVLVGEMPPVPQAATSQPAP